MDKIPWSLVEPLQKIASSITPNAKIVLCQQWDYNYSIYTRNLFDQYHELILILEEFLSEDTFLNLETKLKTPLYLVNFPYLEKNNILLFSLLGHEIGHLVADKYIKSLGPDVLGYDFRKTLKELYEGKYKGLTPSLSLAKINSSFSLSLYCTSLNFVGVPVKTIFLAS